MTPGGLTIRELNDLLDRLALSENRLNLILNFTFFLKFIYLNWEQKLFKDTNSRRSELNVKKEQSYSEKVNTSQFGQIRPCQLCSNFIN